MVWNMSKTLVIPQKSKLYVKSQGVACNIAATVHYMRYSMDSENNETYKELVSYSQPTVNNVNTILATSSTSGEKRIVKEFYFYNTSGSTQSFSLRIRSYTDITLAAGTSSGQLDDPANYTDTNLIDFVIPSHKVWRFSEAFLLSYPSVIVLSKESNFDEISVVLAATGSDVLTSDDRLHITVSHGEVQDSSETIINERLEQKIVAVDGNTQVFSVFKLPSTASRSPNSSVIRQITMYNESGKTMHIKLGFGPPTSTTLNGYLYDGDIASTESWWSDANTFQHIEDYIPSSGGSGAYSLNAVSPLQYISATQTVRINRSGAADGQALIWDNSSNEWKPGDVQPLLTPIAPIEYDLTNLEIRLGQDGATANQVLAWRESTEGANDFRWRPTNASGIGGGSGGGGSGGGSYNGIQIPNLDGGTADTVYGGIAPFDAGNANP